MQVAFDVPEDWDLPVFVKIITSGNEVFTVYPNRAMNFRESRIHGISLGMPFVFLISLSNRAQKAQ